MKEITVKITEKQEKFLKMFAENHYSGAADNKATYNPLHIVQSKRYDHIPYSPDIKGYYDGLPLKFALDQDCKIWYDSETELLNHYFKVKVPPMEIKPFNELLYESVKTPGGDDIYITNYCEYFKAYGTEVLGIAWEKEEYEDKAYFFILKEARRYIKYQSHNLKSPRTFSIAAGYANEGEYQHFYQLLFNLGKQLIETDVQSNSEKPEEKTEGHGRGITYEYAKSMLDECMETSMKLEENAELSKDTRMTVGNYWSGAISAWRQVVQMLCDCREFRSGSIPNTEDLKYIECLKCGYIEV